MAESAPVSYERAGPAFLLTIARPERRNAVDGETAELLREGLRRFEGDDEARALILTGAEPAFCAGADLKALETLDPEHPDGPMGFTRLTPSKPTIAAISGWCLAGGMELALWCDIRIAAEGSVFGLLERRWGVPLIDGGTYRLPRIVGMGRALELILTGRQVDAAEAERIGLVNEVVPPGRHIERAREIAERLANGPTWAIRWTKTSINKILRERLNLVMDTALAVEWLTFMTEDHREAANAFLEKRQPTFRGR
jgi:enoyl-CoA hydratase